ncbi:hypothetical protein BC939DRAFT_526251 [Gamsiella multidivaricata]|uniref:uncharacterized protein n=1 Tax=Gamsiella multidivaricata TaxID=101098 RepID=UPI00221F2772|nr:uncharacterized protein BC939DRAFT_526251 [Gamsiella multidivaricata]KAI7829394.1 hypothetical protein BC939DRAFT_526251 [Gamsiella multidivaricata]
MDDSQPQPHPHYGIGVIRAGDGARHKMVTFSQHTPPKGRQTVIDGFFEPVSNKAVQRHYQMGLSMKSQYFPDDSMLDEDVNLSYDFDDSMHSSESTPQAVPTFPNSGVGSGCDSSLPYRHHHKNGGMFEVFHDDKNRVTVPEGLPKAKAAHAGRGNLLRSSRTKGKTIKTEGPSDPAEVHAGGVRFRSVQFSKSIRHVIDGSIVAEAPEPGLKGSTVALVEVVGTLVSDMTYHNYCWEFMVRDPTLHEYERKHSMAMSLGPRIKSLSIGSPYTLQCRMYDADDSVHQYGFEKEEILRIVGIVTRQGSCGYQMQCVGIRRANMDEVRLTAHEQYRGLAR